ncbi:MAG: hypothetical protein JXX28_07970 [Deltaproteobacteria bacterium]|nr:hypothetical protein [Deltaproteobacteria bacterium]
MRVWTTLLLASTLMSAGCVKQMAVNALADSLTGEGGGSFTSDDDIEFMGDVVPFALKVMESLVDSAPDHVGLHDSLCSGYTQYAMVWVMWPAEQQKFEDYDLYRHGQDRARRFLRRAWTYGMGGLELRHPGFSELLYRDSDAALAMLDDEDEVGAIYWVAASWLARISLSKEDMEALAELPLAAGLLQRALALDEDYDYGAVHDLLIALEPSLPMPGGMERAREHFARAEELNRGRRASPYVSLALSVSLSEQNRAEFVELMERALDVDAEAIPAETLGIRYSQEQAAYYLEHLDDLFAE